MTEQQTTTLEDGVWNDADFWHAMPVDNDGVVSDTARCGWHPNGPTRSVDTLPDNRCPICDALSKEAGAQ